MSVSADSVKVAIDQVRERDRSDGFKGGWLYLVREEEEVGNERGKCHYSPNNNRSSSNREREGVGFESFDV